MTGVQTCALPIYFSNGSEGMDYEARWCDRCVNQGPADGPGCWIWGEHMMHNYEDCNKPHSIMHRLIPRSADGLDNEKCVMFR